MYAAMRLDPQTPDILTCDGNTSIARKKVLDPIFDILTIPKDITARLFTYFDSKQNQSIDIFTLYCKFALDSACRMLFNYQPFSTYESESAVEVIKSVEIMYHAAMNPSLFATEHVMQLTESQVTSAIQTWKTFLATLLTNLKTQYDTNPELLASTAPLAYAIINGWSTQTLYTNETEVIAELHQLLFHVQETVASTCMWITYSLFRHPQVYVFIGVYSRLLMDFVICEFYLGATNT